VASKEHVHSLMADLGPLLELLEVTEFAKENVWTLVVDEQTTVFADYDDGFGRVTLSADVAEVPPGGRERLYELLLTYNNQWSETGGVRMGLDAPGGSVVQMVDLPADGLDLPQLQAVVGNFVDKIRAWREIVAKSGDGLGLRDTGPEDPFMSGMIRG
jgi:hypothetical protein